MDGFESDSNPGVWAHIMQARSSLTDVLSHLLVERERHSRSMNSCRLSPAHTVVWVSSTGSWRDGIKLKLCIY